MTEEIIAEVKNDYAL